MSTIQPDDAFIIHREGKDYKATVDQFAKDINIHVECGGGDGGPVNWDDIEEKPDCFEPCDHSHITKWVPPAPRKGAADLIPACQGYGERPNYPQKHDLVGGVPRHVQLPDGSHNYISVATPGGWAGKPGQACYFLMLDNELNEVKKIETPVPNQEWQGANLASYPNGNPKDDSPVYNILVWSHPDGIWCSHDYGDTWTKFEYKHGTGPNLTVNNCRVYFVYDHEQGETHTIFFDKVADSNRFLFNGVSYKEVNWYLRDPNLNVEDLYAYDFEDGGHDSHNVWTDESRNFSTLQLLSEHHQCGKGEYQHIEDHPWGEFSMNSSRKNAILACEPGAKWERAKGNEFPALTVLLQSKQRFELYKGNVFERWLKTIPEYNLLDDAVCELSKFAVVYDTQQEIYLCRYEGYNLTKSSQVIVHYAQDQIFATRNFQQGWIAYQAAVAPDQQYTARDGDAYEEGVARAYLHHLPGTTSFLWVYDGSRTDRWIGLNSPVNGEQDHWSYNLFETDMNSFNGDTDQWCLTTKDGRLWVGNNITDDPFYSLKRGFYFEDGYFVENPPIDSSVQYLQELREDSGGGDGYTEEESDARFMPLDISTLPPL